MNKKEITEQNPIESYVEKVVNKILDKRDVELKKEDAEEIVQTILPEIERIVSKIILKHFKALATHVQSNLRDPEEK